MKVKIKTKKFQIGVIGSAGMEEYPNGGGASVKTMALAREIGSLLAKRGAIVVTGGKSGIMEAAARGAKEFGGTTAGIVSGPKRNTSNDFTDVEILTGMSVAGYDELLLVLMCDALIVLGGGVGTLEEIAIAYRNRKPVVVLDSEEGWGKDLLSKKYLDSRQTVKIQTAKTSKEAVDKVFSSIK
jgi:uncharacterized protein (TIGR00725 family)